MSTPPDHPDESSPEASPTGAPEALVTAAAIPPPPAAATPARRSGILMRLMTSAVATLLLFSILLNVYLGYFVYVMSSGPNEVTYEEGDAEQRIVILPIEGMIDDEMYQFVRRALKSLRVNKPKALVLRIESGGGGVAPSDKIWNELNHFKEQSGIPIVASFGALAASGGYYVAAGSDLIVAERTCITGSIGVIAPYMTFDGLVEKLGITPEVIVATDSPEKDVATNVLRPWTDKDRQKVTELLDHAHAQFIDVVATGRRGRIKPDQVKALADGGVFTAPEALEEELIDQIGYLSDAISQAEVLAKVSVGTGRVTIMRRPRGLGLLGMLGKRTSISDLMAEQVRRWMLELSMPHLMYQ